MTPILCADCQRAERELWPVYTESYWCCRARHIVDCSASTTIPPQTVSEIRRRMCAAEKRRHPADWPAVRERVMALVDEA